MSEVLYFRHDSSREYDPREPRPSTPTPRSGSTRSRRRSSNAGWPRCLRVQAPAATRAEVELGHAPMLVNHIRRMSLSGGGQLDEDTFVGEASSTAALHAAGGACAMVRAPRQG